MHFTCQKMHSTVRASLAGVLLARPEVNSPMRASEWNFTPLDGMSNSVNPYQTAPSELRMFDQA